MKEYTLQPTDSRKSFYGKARVIEDGDTYTLISYTTAVARIQGGRFARLWDGYSATTMRHINSFRNTYGFESIPKKVWDGLDIED